MRRVSLLVALLVLSLLVPSTAEATSLATAIRRLDTYIARLSHAQSHHWTAARAERIRA